MKLKIKIPGIGFAFAFLSFVFSIVALSMFLNTYDIGGYTLSRKALTCSILALWLEFLLLLNMLFQGEKPSWGGLVYAAIAFLLVYAFAQFIQPCLSPIGFVFGAGDLNMGDTELNKIVANKSIVTSVFYLISALLICISAFISPEWPFIKKKAKESESASSIEEAKEVR